jgi:hypothetical protein
MFWNLVLHISFGFFHFMLCLVLWLVPPVRSALMGWIVFYARSTAQICIDTSRRWSSQRYPIVFFPHVLSCIFIGCTIGSTNELNCFFSTINCFLTYYLSQVCSYVKLSCISVKLDTQYLLSCIHVVLSCMLYLWSCLALQLIGGNYSLDQM